MDEMKMVEQVFAEPKAAPDVAASGRARLLQMAGGDEPSPNRRPVRTRSRWLLGAGLLPVAAASVAAVMLIGDGSAPAQPSSEQPARRILLAAAVKTEAAPAAGRFFRFQTEEGDVRTVGTKERPYKVLDRTVVDYWYATTPGAPSWNSRLSLGGAPVSPADAAAYRAAGSPAKAEEVCPDEGKIIGSRGGKQLPDGTFEEIPVRQKCFRVPMHPRDAWSGRLSMGPGMAGSPPPGLDVAKLSDDPGTLRTQLLAWIHKGGLNTSVEGESAQLWAAAHYLIISPIGPVRPALRAATYRVLAGLPDVRSLGMVTDARGRRGEALSRHGDTSEGVNTGTYRLVIDPKTGNPLETGSVTDGSQHYTSVLEFGYTNDTPPFAK